MVSVRTVVCTPALYMCMLPTFSETRYMDKYTGTCCHPNACTLTQTLQATESNKPIGCCAYSTKQHSRRHSQNVHIGHGCQGRKMHDRHRLIMTWLQQAPDPQRWCTSHKWQPFIAAHLINAQSFVHLSCQPAQPRSTLVLSGQHCMPSIRIQTPLPCGYKVYKCVESRCDVSGWQQLATHQSAPVQSTATWQLT